jgi:3-hydroxy-9,10-secoandrosta-1,3,5(10)-triene-9,17-dione monooxygenase reductase component
MGRFATGVTVLTVNGADARPLGMTASSLASVSLVPPLVSVCVAHEAELHGAILAAPLFVVNILESGQEVLSRRFADQHEDRFDGVGYHRSPEGLVLLDGVLGYLECDRFATYPAGDHTLIIGRVIGGSTGEGRPLIYYRGGYGSLG